MADRWHVDWLKEGVKKWNTRRRKVSFVPDLSSLNFFDLLPPDFRDSPKSSRYFEKIDLSNAIIDHSNLSNLNFSNANFSNASLKESDLSKTNFYGANFSHANLTNANLFRAVLESSRLENTITEGTSFIEVDMKNAIVIGTTLPIATSGALAVQPMRIFDSLTEFKAFSASYKNRLVRFRNPDEHEDRSRKINYDVWYATDRSPIFERGEVIDYGNDHSDSINYGVCEVIIPEKKPIGAIGSPLWRRLFNRKPDQLQLDKLIPLNAELFYKLHCQKQLRAKNYASPTIFIHGYNFSFEAAVLRAAQMGSDLGIGSGIGLFSWPSIGRKRSYAADEASAENSKYSLAKFLSDFLSKSQHENLNIIAHSMGCRIALGAFEILSRDDPDSLRKVNQVILAAADVDTRLVPRISKHTLDKFQRTTSYASEKDKALQLSGWLHQFPRVGISPPTFIFENIDTVIVNDSKLDFISHAYVSSSRTVLSDIFALLTTNAAPSERFGLQELLNAGQQYWRIKD